MAASYQIVILGSDKADLKEALEQDIRLKLSDLGINIDEHIAFLNADNLSQRSKKYPTVGVFFGGDELPQDDIEAVKSLVEEDVIVIPVVENLDGFKALTPECLHPINGTQLDEKNGGIEAISNVVLEALNLLRRARRLFISYRRQESRAIAIQLYEHLHSSGFEVFIDTVSIRPGEPFQEVLWHRLSDTDVVVLLDTPGFLDSRWTTEELANTSAMSIGIIQVIWPGHTPDPKSSLCDRLYLKDTDVVFATDPQNNILTDSAIFGITKAVETIRARSLAARYSSLVGVMGKIAEELGIEVHVQPERYAVVNKNDKCVAVIPTVGVPEALRYQEIAEMFEAIENSPVSSAFLLYDHGMIRDQWRKHLEWLDNHLPVKSIRTVNTETWLRNL